MQELKPRSPGDFVIAILGSDPTAKRLAGLLLDKEFAAAFPWVKLAGNGKDQDNVQAVLHKDAQDLAALPDLSLLFDLRGDPEGLEALRRSLPPTVSVAAPSAAVFLSDLLASGVQCSSCLSDLFHTRNLFHTIFDEVAEDVLLLDTRGRILDLNANVYQRKGRPKEEYVGVYCWELEGREFCCENQDLTCPYRQTLETGRKAEAVHSYVDRDGRMRYFRVYTYPIFDQDKQLSHIMEMRRDITERTSMEMRLQQSEKMAAIGELSTYIAHEIRNPLFAIGGFANSLLRSQSLSESDREKVNIILKESKRLDDILKSTINFARPVEAKQGLVDLNVVAAESLKLLTLGAPDQGIEPVLEADASIAKANVDPELVKQCLINLIKNSMEAMPEGGRLTVRTGVRDHFLFLEVEDTGHGIPEESRPKVFNPFFSTKDKGSGLGLAMTKKIVEDMGGAVELHSQVNVGTRIALLFPPALAVDKKTPAGRDEL